MAATSRIRFRRSAAQLHALAQVEREIRATDPHLRRKYLRDFTEAFQHYTEVLSPEQVAIDLLSSDILLLGDYHAFPRSQQFAAELVEDIALAGRPTVLGLEMVFARDQHILDEWQRGEITDSELRQRIRYDREWGYPWEPVLELLQRARDYNARIFGLDCMPRGDLRRIGARDKHAAMKIGEIHAQHPDAAIIVLFGESHLAPQHLPRMVRALLPAQYRVLTLLQNVDALYWQASGEPGEQVRAVRIDADAICVFNATPLEKYESYRLCIESWRQENRNAAPDLAPSFYNLIEALLRFLHIDPYVATSPCEPRFIVDLFPEIVTFGSDEGARRWLSRNFDNSEINGIMQALSLQGCCYLARPNTLLVRSFQLRSAVDEAARFVCAGGWGEVGRPEPSIPGEELFYRTCLRRALQEYGARVLLPGGDPLREHDLYALYAAQRDELGQEFPFSYRDYMRMIDFVVMHRDFECNARLYNAIPELIAEGRGYEGEQFEFVTSWLGRLLGGDMYDAYLQGGLGKRSVRALFLRRFERPGEAKAAYFRVARRSRRQKHRLAA